MLGGRPGAREWADGVGTLRVAERGVPWQEPAARVSR
jgi:hypothetical protein